MASVRSTRIVITAIFNASIVMLGLGTAGLGEFFSISELQAAGLGLLITHGLTFNLVRADERWLFPWLIASITCPVCSLQLEARNFYKCRCGHIAESHILRVCHACDPPTRFKWLRCPRCGVSINL